MYSRYPNYRFSGGVRVPENYSGNAFSSSEEEKTETAAEEERITAEEAGDLSTVSESTSEREGETKESDEEQTREVFKPNRKGIRFPGFGFDVGKIFSGRFGFEELLLIALILLISQNGADDDIVLMLALLLFIG